MNEVKKTRADIGSALETMMGSRQVTTFVDDGEEYDVEEDADPVAALRGYLSAGRSASARRLREKAAVVLDPPRLRGTFAWP